MRIPTRGLTRLLAAALFALGAGSAGAVPVSFTKLSGLTGDPAIAITAVYKADLSALGSGMFAALQLSDNSGGFGGSTGEFSGFDLDAIKLSTVDCASADCAASAATSVTFDFANSFLAAGSQRPPIAPALFGTVGDLSVDLAVATLDAFDAFASTATPNGFVSLGDFGKLGVNLSAPASLAGLFLYLGEVGDNGEIAGSGVELLSQPIPEAEAWALMALGLGAIGWATRRRHTR